MSETQSYQPAFETRGAQGFEEFGARSQSAELRQKIERLVREDWTPVVEHIEAQRADEHYWQMWKLPMFGQKDVDQILRAINLCRATNPNHAVRVIGYDNSRRRLGARFVVQREMQVEQGH